MANCNVFINCQSGKKDEKNIFSVKHDYFDFHP